MLTKMNSSFDNIRKFLNSTNQILEFKTGGTLSSAKSVKKSVKNVLQEISTLFEELQIPKNLEFVLTTTPEHFFGFTFSAFAIKHGYKINPNRINYPEDLNKKNTVLITTPSFLEIMQKYNFIPCEKPEVIISAGSELKEKIFNYAKSISKRVIEIYGSTETGVIGYRESEAEAFKLLAPVVIQEIGEDFFKIQTPFSYSGIEVLNDKIELVGGKIRFVSRVGKILKIQEKRIDAYEMEKQICLNEYIQDVYCFEYSGKVAALTVLSPLGVDFIIKNGTLDLIKLLKKELDSNFEVVPQRWKFVDEIPKKNNGKFDKEKIKSYFDINLSMPLILSKNVSENFTNYELCFHRNCNFFKGHFEGFPILAGVVQLFFANYFIKESLKKDCHCGQIRKVKFANIIRPDMVVNLEITTTGSGYNYKYYQDDIIFSSGVLPKENTL